MPIRTSPGTGIGLQATTPGTAQVGNLNVNGTIIAGTAITSSGTLAVSTTTTLTGAVSANAAGTGLAVANNETVGGTLVVTGATTLTGGAIGAATADIGTAAAPFRHLYLGTGAAGTSGVSTLAAGTVTVSTTEIKATSKILLARNTPAGTIGDLSAPSASRTANTSFVINSANALDTSTVDWLIVG